MRFRNGKAIARTTLVRKTKRRSGDRRTGDLEIAFPEKESYGKAIARLPECSSPELHLLEKGSDGLEIAFPESTKRIRLSSTPFLYKIPYMKFFTRHRLNL